MTKCRQKLTILDVFHEEPRAWTQVASNTSLHGEEMTRQMLASCGIGDSAGSAPISAIRPLRCVDLNGDAIERGSTGHWRIAHS